MKHYALTVLVMAASGTAAALAAPAPAWVSAPAQASHLSKPVVMDGFQVQVPKGYTEQVMGSSSDKGYVWIGPLPADGHALLMLLSEKTAGPITQSSPLVKTFARIVGTRARHYTGWHVSPVQSGTIHGVSFVRCYWSGTKADSSVKEQGFLYLGRKGKSFFDLSAQKSGPADKAALALAEASVLTFRTN